MFMQIKNMIHGWLNYAILYTCGWRVDMKEYSLRHGKVFRWWKEPGTDCVYHEDVAVRKAIDILWY